MAASVAPPEPSRAVRLRLALAWAALAWERLWAGLWPAATLAMAAVAVALTDVLAALPGLLHLGVLVLGLGGIAALGWRGLRSFAWPSRTEARARLEANSPVSHRPLTATEDNLAVGASPLQRLLWRRHQALARAALRRLRSPWPAPGVARRDGFALRALVILLLAVAAIGAGRDAGDRLVRAVSPAFGDDTPVSVKLWITPPAYTNLSPLYLEAPAADAPPRLDVPAGSKALAVVTGTRRAVSLALSGARRPTAVLPLAPMAAGDTGATSHRLETVLSPAQRLEVRQGARVLAGWDVNWIEDRPPTIAVTGTRDAGRGRLRIDYTAKDDYGLQAVTARIARADSAETLTLALSLPPFGPKETAHSSTHDLGGHPWAGLKASLTLTATDHAGQSATSAAVDVVLPERAFTHPVAREIARWRKELIADPERNAVPARDAFARLMERRSAFDGDRVVFLALADAKYRLSYAAAREAVKGMPELLWQTAVRIEDGNLGAAEQRLEAAERALQEAMERGATAEEIGRLADELQRALANYAKALAERMPDKGAELGGVDQKGNVVSPEDIAATIERLRQLSRIGADDAAKQALAALQNMLQTLRNAAAGNLGENADMKAAEQLMQDMRGLTERQSQLLNESFEQVRQEALQAARQNDSPDASRPRGSDPNAAAKAAERQQKLRQQLGELIGRMANMTGQTPGGMSEADGAMRAAEQALQAGAWKPGADAQGRALSKLETGMQQASQQMMQALAKKGLSGLVQMPGGQRRLDGLGPRNGADDGEQVEVPNGPDTEGMAQRVRAILEEIQRRASDRTRPAAEQEYLRRLMKEF
jgi:uncharacterized protein (TIGR02302 family)